MKRGRLHVVAAVLAALLVAQAAVLGLRPRDGTVAPAAVEVRSYFSAAQLERGRAYRRPNLAIGLGITGLQIALLAVLAARVPRRLRSPRHPVLTGAAAGAALSAALALAPLPLRGVLHQRAVDVGLSTQTWGAWLADVGRGLLIGAVFAAAGGALAVWLLRRLQRRWWLAGAAAIWLFGAGTVALGPLVLDPVYNEFRPLRGALRADVVTLARRAGVDVGEVYVMDASRRTTAANAYVTGLGTTKRVVLYDNLVRRFPRAQARSVVAHELAHQRHGDLWGGLLFLALVAPAGMWAAAVWVRRAAPAGGPAALPTLALAITVVSLGTGWISNQLSRAVEARADSTALALTAEPDAFIALQQRIATRNVADPDPPRWSVFLFGTHPPTLERIGAAVSFRAAARRRTPAGS